ncbi:MULTISPECIES: hypothetical protein [Capnocytophaga]|uniref:hypothetical protein n=1 Tax=Capnocytophaga TaxID=1016 RepID=UPI0012DDA432|nr:hypothetical protein [Capnocytophaga ochracea]UEB43855.1 hypothetical protein LK419_02410 [Capnocytophaga ochracea]
MKRILLIFSVVALLFTTYGCSYVSTYEECSTNKVTALMIVNSLPIIPFKK